MALYKSAKYGAIKYGASSTTAIRWGLDIDWDDSGTFSGDNDAERMQALSVNRGRNYFISSGGDAFEPVQVGTCEIILSNHDGRYDPYNTSSPLYPNVAPGKFMRLRVRYGTVTYPVFAGMVMNIVSSGFASEATVQISCEDGLRWLQDFSAVTNIYQKIYADEAIETLLILAKWPTQWGYSLTKGADILDYWWGKDRTISEEITALADSEIAKVFVNSSGAFVFQKRSSVLPATADLDQAQMLKSITLLNPWEVQRNYCSVKSNPITATASGDIWDGSGLPIGAGQTVTIFAEFSGGAIDVIAPVATTDYLAYRNSDGTGTNLTGYITITTTIMAEKAMLTITNSYTRVAYLTLLKMRGKLLVSSSTSAEAFATGYEKHPRGIRLDLEWQQDTNNPATFSEQILEILNTAPPLPTFQYDTRPDIQFGVDIFDNIIISVARLNITNAQYKISGISHEWTSQTGQAVKTTIRTEPYWYYEFWRFNDNNVLGANKLGW